jgi:hypothetical protein
LVTGASGVKERGSDRQTDLSGAWHIGDGKSSRRAVRRAGSARSRGTSGWLLLCLALLVVYVVAVFAMANLLRAISF